MTDSPYSPDSHATPDAAGAKDAGATDGAPLLSGRQAEAARNDRTILEAARTVFLRDPKAPIAAVAAEAGVGVGALYRRYASKEVLLQTLCTDGLRQFVAIAE